MTLYNELKNILSLLSDFAIYNAKFIVDNRSNMPPKKHLSPHYLVTLVKTCHLYK